MARLIALVRVGSILAPGCAIFALSKVRGLSNHVILGRIFVATYELFHGSVVQVLLLSRRRQVAEAPHWHKRHESSPFELTIKSCIFCAKGAGEDVERSTALRHKSPSS